MGNYNGPLKSNGDNKAKVRNSFTTVYTGRTPIEFRTPDDTYADFAGGVPLMATNTDGGTEITVDSSNTHTVVFGTTGSLKTRAVVMPTVKILGLAGESMIINDPKAELYVRHAKELEERGYKIISINFRDPQYGNAWNPLAIPYKFFLDGNADAATAFANDIAQNLALADVSAKDPFWDYSAADLLFGLIMLLFEYCKANSLPADAVNISNLIRLRQNIFNSARAASDSELWKFASAHELTASALSGTVFAPANTQRSILSVFDQKIRALVIQPVLSDMLADNDFDIAAIGSEKTAVFIITPDEKTTFHRLVTLFVKQSYEYLIYCASRSAANAVAVRVNYILDEFASLPRITDFPAMISAARSRNMRFLLVVQSRGQLTKRYENEDETIIANCGNWIFFTSRELPLLKTLSELCGTDCSKQPFKPNISVYDLQHLDKTRYEALVMCARLDPIITELADINKYGRDYGNRGFSPAVRRKPYVLDLPNSETDEQAVDKVLRMLGLDGNKPDGTDGQ